MEEVTYKDGQVDGKYTFWYENGNKKEEGINKGVDYKGNPTKDGKWTYWSPDGKESSELIYRDGNPWVGKLTERYDNGNKKKEGTYKNGEKIGKLTFWYENGQKRKEGNYEGKINSGTVSHNEGRYRYGRQVDEWTYYNEDGSVKY